MKEHILAFGCETIAPLLTQTFAPRKMAVKAVPLADYAQTVGALAGAADCLRTEEVYAGLPLGEPMLVFLRLLRRPHEPRAECHATHRTAHSV